VVPPHQAVWMPGATGHRIDARSAVAMRTLYIEPNASLELPGDVCVLQISPLLRELILVAVDEGPHYEPHHPQARLSAVILDQICVQSIAPLALPMPTDPRLLRVTKALISNPGDNRDLADWVQLAGASKRTLGRLFVAQTGMSFRTWRQQCRLLRALELLATGENVTNIALMLGYESTSAFIAMFRRYLGTTPSRYLRHKLVF
jgi:AraC-like DNA-binding protein